MNPPSQTPKPKKHHRSRHHGRRPRQRTQGAVATDIRLAKPVSPTTPSKRHVLRVYALGGLEEVGRNCTVFEYNDSIIIVDLGLQFPEEDMPGIDYIIPNITSLRGKEQKIKALIITHGHLDHIGAVPHLAGQLGNPPIYALPLTCGMMKRRQEDFHNQHLNLQVVRRDTRLRLGDFAVEFFGVSHNIPDAMGVVLTTPAGSVVHTGDFKIDPPERGANKSEIDRIRAIGKRGVTMLMMDSTNAMKPGHQLTEEQIAKVLEQIIRNARGRIIFGTFSSLISRLGQLITLAERYGRRVVVMGYSMRKNLELAAELGYIRFKKDTVVPAQFAHKVPDHRLMILCTGAQGEDNAALMRITTREDRFIRIQKGDTVVFSSSVIPGNERSVQRLTDGLYMEGADVINYQMMDVHAGGHAMQEDLKDMVRMIRPRYVLPVHGNFSFRKIHEKVMVEAGLDSKNVLVPVNGQIVEIEKGVARVTNQRVTTDYVFVDGLGVGDISNIVLRDRQQMADDGMVVVIATVQGKTGNLIGTPDIITRGFVHVQESQRLINEIKQKTKKLLQDRDPNVPANDTYLRNKLRDSLGQFLFTKTQRRPMVLPVIMEV